MYTLLWSDHTEEFNARADAVSAAKDLSEGKRNPVEVLDEEHRELLVFRDGSLTKYLFETRPGKTVRS